METTIVYRCIIKFTFIIKLQIIREGWRGIKHGYIRRDGVIGRQKSIRTSECDCGWHLWFSLPATIVGEVGERGRKRLAKCISRYCEVSQRVREAIYWVISSTQIEACECWGKVVYWVIKLGAKGEVRKTGRRRSTD